MGFNTVGTVKDGSLVIEERDLNDSDWKQYDMQSSASMDASSDPISGSMSSSRERELTAEEKEEEKKRRKMAYNAPKMIAKLEWQIEACEKRIAELDDEMLTVGNDVGKLTDISNEKTKEEEKVAEMMTEWEEELEELLAEMTWAKLNLLTWY